MSKCTTAFAAGRFWIHHRTVSFFYVLRILSTFKISTPCAVLHAWNIILCIILSTAYMHEYRSKHCHALHFGRSMQAGGRDYRVIAIACTLSCMGKLHPSAWTTAALGLHGKPAQRVLLKAVRNRLEPSGRRPEPSVAVRSRPDTVLTPPGAVRMPPWSVDIRILQGPSRYHQQLHILVSLPLDGCWS